MAQRRGHVPSEALSPQTGPATVAVRPSVSRLSSGPESLGHGLRPLCPRVTRRELRGSRSLTLRRRTCSGATSHFPPQALPRRDSRFAHRAWRPRRRRRRSVAKSTSTWVGWSVVTSTQMAAVGGDVHVDVGGGPCDGPPGPTRGAHRCIGNWVPRSPCQTMSSWPVCFRAVPPQQPPGPASGSHTDRGAGRKRFQLLLPDVAASVHLGRFLACAPGETPPAKHSASV